MKATGVDQSSKFQLKRLAAEGYTAEEISSMIQVEEKSVKSWMKHLGFGPQVVVDPVPLDENFNDEADKEFFAKVAKKKSKSKEE